MWKYGMKTAVLIVALFAYFNTETACSILSDVILLEALTMLFEWIRLKQRRFWATHVDRIEALSFFKGLDSKKCLLLRVFTIV